MATTTNISGTIGVGVAKSYVDGTFVFKSGDTMTGTLNTPDIVTDTLCATGYVGIGTAMQVNDTHTIIKGNTSRVNDGYLIIGDENTADRIRFGQIGGSASIGFNGNTSTRFRTYGCHSLEFAAQYHSTSEIAFRTHSNVRFTNEAFATKMMFNVDTEKLGIGTESPTHKLQVAGTGATDAIRTDMGLDIYPVPDPDTFTGVAIAGGDMGTGWYYYFYTYVTAFGESATIRLYVATTAGNNTIRLSIPVSPDHRVIARNIYRGKVDVYYSQTYELTTINDNTTTTYDDSAADATLTVVNNVYARPNTTTNFITLGGEPAMSVGAGSTLLGIGAGAVNAGDLLAIGTYAGNVNTTSNYNSFVGNYAGYCATGGYNTSLGNSALKSTTSGAGNVAIGAWAVRDAVQKSYNVGIGYLAMLNDTGNYNIAIGANTMRTIINGDENVFLGYQAGCNASQCNSVSNSIVIGSNTYSTKSNQTVIGNASTTETILRGDVTTDGNIDAYSYNINQVTDPDTAPTGVVSAGGAVDNGAHKYYVAYVTASGQTHISPQSATITTSAGNNTVTLTIQVSDDPRVTGRRLYRSKTGQEQAFQEYYLDDVAENTSTEYVDVIADADLGDYQTGLNAMNTTTPFITNAGSRIMVTDTKGTFLGIDAGRLLTEIGGTNTLIGYQAGNDLTTGLANTFVGMGAGWNVVSSNLNTAVGAYALGGASSADNVAIGGYSSYSQTGTANVGVGKSSLQSVIGNYNTGIGNFAGAYRGSAGTTTWTSGCGNVLIGYMARASANGVCNEIAIGIDSVGMGQDTIVMGNTNTEKFYMNGDFVMNDTQWDDMRFPAVTSRLGITSKPDFDFTNIGLLFPEDDESEYIMVADQFSHSYKTSTNISPHIHFLQEEATVPVWTLSYRWYDNGTLPPAFTPIDTDGSVEFAYTGGTQFNITEFPAIDGSHITGVSSWFEGKIYRKTGDGVTGDVLYKTFDIHYQKDGVGSNTQYGK